MKLNVPDKLELPDCHGCAAIQLGQELFKLAEQLAIRHDMEPELMQQGLIEATVAWICCTLGARDEGTAPLDDRLDATVTEFERALRYEASKVVPDKVTSAYLGDELAPPHRH